MKHSINIILKYLKNKKWSFTFSVVAYFASAVLAMVPAKVLQLVIDEGFIKKNANALFTYITLLLFIYLLKTLFTYTSSGGLIEIGNGILIKIKSEIYEKLMAMDLSFYSNNDIGYINARVEEISLIDDLFSNQILSLISSLIEFIMALIILYSLNLKMLMILSVPIPFLIIISYILTKKITSQVEDTLDSSAEYSGKMQDTIRGMETVKAQGLEEQESKKINEYNQTALDKQKKQSHAINGFSVGMGSVSSIINVIVYLIGGLFYISGEITMGSFFAISTYAGKLYSPILNYAIMSMIIQPAYLALKRVSDFFFSKEETSNIEQETISSIELIEFKNISFSYQKEERLIHDFCLSIHSGDKVHLIGSNGSGKSTIIRLLLRLIDLDSGSILINGIDISKIERSSIIHQVSYVSQRNYVFNESIEDNVKYGIENPNQSHYQSIIDGLNLTEVIDRLATEGISKIGENGSRLSGGEIQKICIARALLLNRNIFILDEALTNLDKSAFKYVIDIIKNSNATWLIIDHQTSLKEYGFIEVPIKIVE